jgi:plasmid stabilization system protein ParE
MMFELRLRPRAAVELRQIMEDHRRLGQERSFVAELDALFDMLRALPRRYPLVAGPIHRALLRKYPYAVFFRIRAEPVVVVLAVLHQRRDPATWPK